MTCLLAFASASDAPIASIAIVTSDFHSLAWPKIAPVSQVVSAHTPTGDSRAPEPTLGRSSLPASLLMLALFDASKTILVSNKLLEFVQASAGTLLVLSVYATVTIRSQR